MPFNLTGGEVLLVLGIGVLLLAQFGLMIWALVHVHSSSASVAHKLLWTIIVLMAPLLGSGLYLLIGRKSVTAADDSVPD
ncbi:MAG TPA: PLD nuclease N-terminal domain-containing protein [Phycisphaerales bacterium]|nr:PLD nuclease N-terminal domain-containing protein [Phycisphaerales bacterium]